MRVLADTCVHGGLVAHLRDRGHDVESTAEWPADPGDAEILAHAHAQGRVLLTFDKDFGELAVALGHPHGGIVRVLAMTLDQMKVRCEAALAAHQVELEAGGIVTIELGRTRIRPAPAH